MSKNVKIKAARPHSQDPADHPQTTDHVPRQSPEPSAGSDRQRGISPPEPLPPTVEATNVEASATSDNRSQDGTKPRTRRTSHQRGGEATTATLLQQWQTRSTLDLPFTRDEDCSAALPVEVQSPAHLKTIFLGAGQPLNYAIDSAFQFLELEPEFSRAYQPRTSMLARAARDVVASTLGRALKDVDLKPVLWLDKASHRASPMWCIRFRSTGLAANAMQDIEGNLRALVGLIASDGRTLWATPIADLLPDIEAAEAVVKAAKEVRSTAGGKPAAPDCRVTSPDFSTEIELPTKIGSGPDSEQEAVVKVGVGEVMGYNRQARQMDFLIDGHSTTTDISMDMAVFRELVQSLAGSDGNECRIWYRIDREDGKAVRTTLCKLQHIQSDLFNQLPDFKEAEVTADPVTA